MAKAKEQNYLHGAAIMTAGVIIMKILGALYKIPLGNMLGDDGYALFLQAYYVYSVFLTLATAGFPVALSRMISAAQTKGLQMQARRTYHVAWWTFFALGVFSSTIMFVFPDWLATTLIHSPDAALSIQALSPAVLLCCITATYRGLTQGYENMTPTTVSQILEVLAKVAAGVMQTHSACADARREAIITHLALMGAERCLLQAVYDSVTTEAAVGLIRAAGMDEVWNRLAQAAKRYCTLRVRGQIEIEIVFTGSAGEMLGGTVEP